MEYHDFREDEDYSMAGKTTIWSERIIEVGLELGDERGKREQVLRYIDAINKQLDWIRNNRAIITDMLVKSGMLTLAEDWIIGDEDLEEGETRVFKLEDGTDVAIPMTEKAFKSSLRMNSITIDLTEGRENMITELYLTCEPDYFGGHCIVLDIMHDGTMECRGLWG